jgi:SAM-dependent methyltransferase
MAGIATKLKTFVTDFQLSRLTPTGVESAQCSLCGSTEVACERGRWLHLPYEIPRSAHHLRDQMHRRDNGVCQACGLEQAFYKFSDEGRKVFYDLGLDVLASTPEFGVYPPSEAWQKQVYERFGYPRRLAKWEAWFAASGTPPPRRMLHLRCQYGEILRHFHERHGTEVWGTDVVHTCLRHVQEHVPFVRQPGGSCAAKFELQFPPGMRFDFIICFHTLTHSQDLRGDLDQLRSWLAPGGVAVFSEEISKKQHNPFHMIHADEAAFVRVLRRYFPQMERLDDCGHHDPHTTPFTLKGDNPDYIVWKERA